MPGKPRRYVYPGLVMVRIWLPADVHGRLLEGLPDWAPTHQVLEEATEMHYAVGVRRVTCGLPDALALLKRAETVYPEAAHLIRIAIRKAGATPGTRNHVEPVADPPPAPSHDLRPRFSVLESLASVHILVFSFQALHLLDRARDVLRRLF